MPIPAHAPLIAAMTGLGIVVVYDCKRPPAADSAPAFDPPEDDRPIDCNASISAPAQKPFPAPVTTSTRTSSFATHSSINVK
ncbi:unannotated protein [freshwater metagenome]|uniref:Unannotated protein n=1 Tax=freshwater metagenome TaxID=449393 RepID=A0A6J7QHH4_9ZZZZ